MPFPPTTSEEIDDYDDDEVLEGFRDGHNEPDRQIPPASHHSDAYRWGWQNAVRDHQREDDGHDEVRDAYFQRKFRPKLKR